MIPVFKPELTLADKFSVLNALLKNNISGTSPIVSDFENNIPQNSIESLALL